jgi:hypothetical protein
MKMWPMGQALGLVQMTCVLPKLILPGTQPA